MSFLLHTSGSVGAQGAIPWGDPAPGGIGGMDSGDLQSGNRRGREIQTERGIERGSSPAATPAWVHDPLPDPFPLCRIKELNHFTAPTVHPGLLRDACVERI